MEKTNENLSHHTCMHWKSSVMMLERATSCSTCPPKPSARPLRRSKATIMKSLSGASYWSGCWLYIYSDIAGNRSPFFWKTQNVLSVAWGRSHHRLSKCLLDKRDTALVDRLTVRQEATLQSRSYWRQTLEETNRTMLITGRNVQSFFLLRLLALIWAIFKVWYLDQNK